MDLVKEIRESDIIPGASQEDIRYQLRRAARAVVTNGTGKVALLFVSHKGYHKLPGGGVERGEDIIGALRREVKEETGCEVELEGEVGLTIEYRDKIGQKQRSYCFLVKVDGDCGGTAYTDKEQSGGFQLKWVPVSEARELLQKDRPDSYVGKFIRARDLALLEKAAELYELK